MPSQRIAIEMELPFPVAGVFAFMAAHENQPRILGARVERLRDGDGHRDGVGSSRRMFMAPLPSWDETVTAFELDRRIEYRISRGGPLRGHRGTILFAPVGASAERTRLDYTITFDPLVPLTGSLLRVLTERSLRRGLAAVAAARTLPA